MKWGSTSNIFVCAFCYELAETGKSGMVNQCFSLLKELKLQKPIFAEDRLLKLRTKYSNSAILMLQEFGPIYVHLRMRSTPRKIH